MWGSKTSSSLSERNFLETDSRAGALVLMSDSSAMLGAQLQQICEDRASAALCTEPGTGMRPVQRCWQGLRGGELDVTDSPSCSLSLSLNG